MATYPRAAYPRMTYPRPDLRPGRLKELDGWRAISVILVIVHHICWGQCGQILSPHARLFHVFRYMGPLAVKIFFVISGFVICRLMIHEEHREGSVSLKAFYIRRAFRIIPPFYAYLAVVALLTLLHWIVNPWGAMLAGLFFVYDLLINNAHDWFVGHAWSLAVEEQFYLVFPTLWLLCRKMNRVRFFSIVFCLIVAWNVIAAVFSGDGIMTPVARPGFASICCGVIMALMERRARIIARAVPSIVPAVLMLILLWNPLFLPKWSSAVYECIFMPPAIALILMYSVEREGWLRSLLLWRPLQAVGVTSYGIYLWQELFTGHAPDLTPAGKPLAFMLPLLLVIIPLSWRFIEKPAMEIGRSLATRSRSKQKKEERVLVYG